MDLVKDILRVCSIVSMLVEVAASVTMLNFMMFSIITLTMYQVHDMRLMAQINPKKYLKCVGRN